jgi:hypothetical protein
MTDQSARPQDPDDPEPPNKDAGVVRDVLATFNAEDAVDEPGRPRRLDPDESLPDEADIPQPQ